MNFATPLAFALLPLLAAIALASVLRPRRHAALAVAEDGVARAAAAVPSWRIRLRWLPTLLRWTAIALLIFALARPRQGLAVTLLPEEGIDVVVTVDASSSMSSTPTSPGGPFRLNVARDVVGDFVETLDGDRVGIVIFQSRALALSPLTHDLRAIQDRVESLRSGLVEDGTAIGLGVTEALTLLEESPARNRVVVLLTDGQNNAGDVDPMTAARVAEATGVRLYTIGFTQGPGGLQQPGIVDAQGLTRMAELTGGHFFDARTQTELAEAYAEIGELERSRVGERQFTRFREFAPIVAAAALALLVLDGTLRGTWLRRYP